MRKWLVAAVFIAACGLTYAGPAPVARLIGDAPRRIPPPVDIADADGDGFVVTEDCNDDNALARPDALERANGVDDNCNGVVDDGFDTTVDWPSVKLAVPIWPPKGADEPGEIISTATQPRLVWDEDRFMAVWIDTWDRLNFVYFDEEGRLPGKPEVLAKAVYDFDIAWTGSHMGIVYQSRNWFGLSIIGLLTVNRDGVPENDALIVINGSEPKIAWGQDRFGVVWQTRESSDPVRFRQFSLTGVPLSDVEALKYSGGNASIAFSGTTVKRQKDGSWAAHDGQFGIVYEGPWESLPSGDVYLMAWPREAGSSLPTGPIRVNQHEDPLTKLGARPAITGNPSGFAVAWHTVESEKDRAQARYFSHEALEPVQEFIPDWDAGRYGRMAWTGGEFLMVNDNVTGTMGDGLDVHFRRADSSCNTHLVAADDAWGELNLRESVSGFVSAHPDVANAGQLIGVVWVEGLEYEKWTAGPLWFALISHQ